MTVVVLLPDWSVFLGDDCFLVVWSNCLYALDSGIVCERR